MSAVRTRQQSNMALALEHMLQVKDTPNAKVYGQLCLKLPVLVQTNGLCQTLAFLEDKGAKDANGPHQTLLLHIAEVLDVERPALLNDVRDAPLMTYIFYSRRIMQAWVFYKRFSASILGVENTDEGEER